MFVDYWCEIIYVLLVCWIWVCRFYDGDQNFIVDLFGWVEMENGKVVSDDDDGYVF